MKGVRPSYARTAAHQLELAADSSVLETKLETRKENYILRTNIFCFHVCD